MQPKVLVGLEIRLQDGSKKTVWVDPYDPSKITPTLILEWGTSRGKPSPHSLRTPKENAKRGCHPHSLPEVGSGVVVSPLVALHLPSAGVLGRSSENTTQALKAELAHLRECVAEWSLRLDELDRLLAPAWAERNYIRGCLLETHPRKKYRTKEGDALNGVVFQFVGREERKKCWRESIAIDVQWGRKFGERTRWNSMVKAGERRMVNIERALKKEQDRWQKRKK